MANSISPFVDSSPQYARQFDIESINGDQRQRIAEMLRGQMFNQPQGQMVSGWYVPPSIAQQIAPVVSGLVGTYMGKDLDDERAKKTAEALKRFGGVEEEVPMANIPGLNNNAGMAEGQSLPEGSPEQSPMNPAMAPKQTRMRPLTQDEQDMAMLNLASVNPTMAGIYGNLQGARAKRAYDEEQRTLDRQAKFDLARENNLARQDNIRLMSALRPATPEPLVAVMGKDGNPVMVPRGQAVGMTPFNAQTAGTAGGSPAARVKDANDAVDIVLKAAPMIRQSTNSGIGAAVDWAGGLIGASPKGADVAASLKVLGGQLVSKMPKMSGPQSDKDVLLYKEMAGRLGDPTVPASQKEAALQTIYDINAKYAGLPEQTLSFDTSSVMQGSNSSSSKW